MTGEPGVPSSVMHRCLIPLLIIVMIVPEAVFLTGTVTTGVLMIERTGPSAGSPPATTFFLRSVSVTIPRGRRFSSTTTMEPTFRSDMRAAAA